jgi:hypothetical protein
MINMNNMNIGTILTQELYGDRRLLGIVIKISKWRDFFCDWPSETVETYTIYWFGHGSTSNIDRRSNGIAEYRSMADDITDYITLL